MISSVWRFAHLSLAILSSAFLIVLAITGVILAYDAVEEKATSYRVENFDSLNLSQSVSELRKVYPEIIEVNINHQQAVSIDAIDEDGNTVKGYINPITGEVLGNIKPKSDFIQWVTALHRSLFLKETGRIIVAVVSFLLFLITISGFVLILKRQQGLKNFFTKIHNDFFSQYFHVVTGRLFLIPILIISFTGAYLFLLRLEGFKGKNEEIAHTLTNNDSLVDIENFEVFKSIKLAEVEKIEFPFIADDPEEFFVIKLKDREISVNQINGEIVEETKYPYSAALEKLNLDLHTGRTSIIWAIILGLASLNILFFIYSGFIITFKRTRTKIKNKFKANDAEIIILVGTENGSTLFFANKVHQQFLAAGKIAFIANINQYQVYPNAKQLLVFTSTYGIGTAPTNANLFNQLIAKHPQNQQIDFSVIGFGSKSYPDFCAFAIETDNLLAQQNWANRILPIHNINDKSVDEFLVWVNQWNQKSDSQLMNTATQYTEKLTGFKALTVTQKTNTTAANATFKILLKPNAKVKFQSGDLLAIYPDNDNKERLYSIGEDNGEIQLMVKLYENGLGSGFLYQLKQNDTIKARIIANPSFHFPKKAKSVAMIANGTGIAPFLGMIKHNNNTTPIYLYAGFRQNNELTEYYQQFANEEITNKKLNKFEIAFSREQQKQYVMDLIKRDGDFFIDLLENNGTVMICGSLNMQKNVEEVLEEIALAKNKKPLSFYKNNKQILTDCY